MTQALLALSYLAASVLLILGLKQLSSPRTAMRGNATAASGMLVAIVATLRHWDIVEYHGIVVGLLAGSAAGVVLAYRTPKTAMLQTVAFLNGLGGGASALVSLWMVVQPRPEPPSMASLSGVAAGILLGALAFSGSLLAWLKLQEWVSSRAIRSRALTTANAVLGVASLVLCGMLLGAPTNDWVMAALTALPLILGLTWVMPIGGAEMPVVIAFLNALSGLAAGATGFALGNSVLIIGGALVGSTGVLLSGLMCTAMHRPLVDVLFSGRGARAAGQAAVASTATPVVGHTVEEAAMVLEGAQKVVVVPGYGLAVAQAQHVVREVADLLEKRGVEVLYAIHPVAGRMPGHMGVLLAEANVSYDRLKDLEEIESSFPETDVALVVGANDVVNPLARTDASSPIYGMPILDADKARTCIVIKRSMSPGFSGIPNPLYAAERTMMVFGDAKETLIALVKQLKQG